MPIEVGDKVLYWPERKPFLARESFPASVLGFDDRDPELVRLSVSNASTGRTFMVSAHAAEAPAPGAFTVEPSKTSAEAPRSQPKPEPAPESTPKA